MSDMRVVNAGPVPHNEDLPTSPPKRRKLKHPRTSRACVFCRRRKVRCSGTQPCDYCSGEGVRCEYDDGIPRPPPSARQNLTRNVFDQPQYQSLADGAVPSPSTQPDQIVPSMQRLYPPPLDNMSGEGTPRGSRRASLEPPQTFAEGQHIGPTAGVSFLYHGWNRGENSNSDSEATLPSASLMSHGDIPHIPLTRDEPLPTRDEANAWLDRYFRFATPTYRYLHRPTVEKWMSQLLAGDKLPVPQAACAFLVCSQALLFTTDGDRYGDGGDTELNRNCERAKSLINQEPGPATLASVQARLALCLYLLSTFRINECRYVFSMACAILTTLGLQRKAGPGHKFDLLTSECRKRTFWCAYVLDDYLSVMLGRPRILRDEDIDQPYPLNIDDQDLLSSESAEDLPLHGNLEAFIAHADLAKLMGRNSDLLYPLRPLTEDQVFERTNIMLEELRKWRERLPDFLKPREKTLAGQRTFERQNTVLKLAAEHLRILITRRCLLADFSRLGRNAPSLKDERAAFPIQECASAIRKTLNATFELVQRGTLYQAFWFTQYISLVAISTLYVFVIQSSRATIPTNAFPDITTFLEKAQATQDYLAKISPEGSPARRHHVLLDRLRERAQKDAARGRQTNQKVTSKEKSTLTPIQPAVTETGGTQNFALQQPTHERHSSLVSVADSNFDQIQVPSQFEQYGPQKQAADLEVGFGPTPSEEDYMFQNLLGWGWENLDTVGFSADGDGFIFHT